MFGCADWFIGRGEGGGEMIFFALKINVCDSCLVLSLNHCGALRKRKITLLTSQTRRYDILGKQEHTVEDILLISKF